MVSIDLGDTIRYDPDVVEVFEQTICLIAVSRPKIYRRPLEE